MRQYGRKESHRLAMAAATKNNLYWVVCLVESMLVVVSALTMPAIFKGIRRRFAALQRARRFLVVPLSSRPFHLSLDETT
jgi:hypothetical protein